MVLVFCQKMDHGRGTGRGRGGYLPERDIMPEDHVGSEEELGNESHSYAQSVRTVHMNEHTANLFAKFLQAKGYGNPEPLLAAIPKQAVADPDRMTKLVKDLRRLGAKTFSRESDYSKADKWLGNLKTHFEMLNCSKIEQRKLVVYLLEDDARLWWTSVKREKDVTTMTFGEFEKAFNDKYILPVVRNGLHVQFLNLKHGTMTVREYEAKFYELYRFSQVLPDEVKARKFEEGLNEYIKKSVVNVNHDSLAKVVNCVVIVEKNNVKFKKFLEGKQDTKGKGKAPAQSSSIVKLKANKK